MQVRMKVLGVVLLTCATSMFAQTNTFPTTGNVGIGTTNPSGILGIGSASIPMGITTELGGMTPLLNLDVNFREASVNTAYPGGAFRIDTRSAFPLLQFLTRPANGTETVAMSITQTSNVGIGTTTPGAKLEVNGNVLLTAGSGASMTFPDGTVQATAWNGTTLGGDYAESVDVQGERARYEPGDVIVIDASSPGRFGRSQVPYSKLVAGVYSTKPGLVGRRTTAERPNKDAEVPMAMMGIVPTKVTTENGPIEPGDLLVSSSTAGYAMKGTDRDRLMGTVIGKALSPMKSGNGVIEVLLAFQ